MENWLGTLAALLTTASFVPQTIKLIRDRETSGISTGMYAMFTAGVALWLVYGLLIHSFPVCLANGVTLLLAGTILIMKIRLG